MALARQPALDQDWIIREFLHAAARLGDLREVRAARLGTYVEFLVVVAGDRDDAIDLLEPGLTDLRRERAAFDYRIAEGDPGPVSGLFQVVSD